MPSFRERVAGGMFGLLIGDALGVPYEFRKPEDLPPNVPTGYCPPPDFDRAHASVPPGTWSDDGAQALCLLASLLDQQRFDPNDFGQRIVRWYEEGYLAVDGIVFDIGVTTGKAIQSLKAGVPALEAGPRDVMDNGNGSLMRVLPLALWHTGSLDALVSDAHDQSAVTHGHARSKVCCALYAIWARMIVLEVDDPWTQALTHLRHIYTNAPVFLEELEWSVRPEQFDTGTGSGYVVDSLRSAHIASRAADFGGVIRAAVAFGHDTDTTACIAGGIAGVKMGVEAIPIEWRAQLRGQDLFEPLLTRLLQVVSRPPSP